MKHIFAAYKRYNANSNDKSVGDCVKRALSFAYSADYDEISRTLNRLKRELNAGYFNSPIVFKTFLKNNGAKQITDLPKGEDRLSEQEFCDTYKSGTYILLTGPKDKNYSTHMVCIMNGDIYDSWNSSKYAVVEAFEIPNAKNVVEDIVWEDIETEMNSFADAYLYKVNQKYKDWFRVWRAPGYRRNDLTYNMQFRLLTSKDLPKESDLYANQEYSKRIIVKLNPKMNKDQNLKSLQPKLKERLYNWLYEFEKDYRDTKAIANMETHPNYAKDQWSRKDLLKLPAWCRPYVRSFFWSPNSKYSYEEYRVRLQALPDDPYVDDLGDIIVFEEDTLKDLKTALENYHKDFSRPGYHF